MELFDEYIQTNQTLNSKSSHISINGILIIIQIICTPVLHAMCVCISGVIVIIAVCGFLYSPLLPPINSNVFYYRDEEYDISYYRFIHLICVWLVCSFIIINEITDISL